MNKVMTARYPGKCAVCAQYFPAGTAIVYSSTSRLAVHVNCPAKVAAPAPEPKLIVDVKNIIAFIEGARSRGLRNPKLRVAGPNGEGEVRMMVASHVSKTPGSLFVKWNGMYVGAVRPTGEVSGGLRNDYNMRTLLGVVNSAPLAAARMFAAITCNCSFCGLPLTDEGSTEVGYGPVCAKHWGLPHKAKGTQELSPVVDVVVTPEPSPVDDLLGDDEAEAQEQRALVAQLGLW